MRKREKCHIFRPSTSQLNCNRNNLFTAGRGLIFFCFFFYIFHCVLNFSQYLETDKRGDNENWKKEMNDAFFCFVFWIFHVQQSVWRLMTTMTVATRVQIVLTGDVMMVPAATPPSPVHAVSNLIFLHASSWTCTSVNVWATFIKNNCHKKLESCHLIRQEVN